MAGNVGTALLLTTAAGLSTTIGSFIGLAVRKPGRRFVGFTLGFSAGVMVLVSFVELLPSSIGRIGFAQAHAAFFAGMVGFFFLDFFIPHDYIGQHDHREGGQESELKRV